MGIPLLTPERIKDSRTEEYNAVQRRTVGLAIEENRIVSSLNLTRDAANETREEIAQGLMMYQSQANDRKKVIDEEILSRERTRDAILPAVKRREDEVAARETAQDDREKQHTGKEEALVSRETSVKSRETVAETREKGLDERESAIAPREEAQNHRQERLNASAQQVQKDRDAHDERVRAFEVQASNIMAANDADASANAIERERLQKQASDQQKKDVEIADRYAQLEKTAEAVRKMQQKSS